MERAQNFEKVIWVSLETSGVEESKGGRHEADLISSRVSSRDTQGEREVGLLTRKRKVREIHIWAVVSIGGPHESI